MSNFVKTVWTEGTHPDLPSDVQVEIDDDLVLEYVDYITKLDETELSIHRSLAVRQLLDQGKVYFQGKLFIKKSRLN